MSEKRLIEVEVTEKVKRMVEVEFPLYRASGDSGESGSWETFWRIDADLSGVCITCRTWWNNDDVEYEVEKLSPGHRGWGDMLLPKPSDSSPSASKEFYEALAAMRKLLDSLPPDES